MYIHLKFERIFSAVMRGKLKSLPLDYKKNIKLYDMLSELSHRNQ